jgi:hypothetical protein
VAGRIDATIDWTFPTSSIGVYIVRVAAGCNVEEISADTCTFIASSDPPGAKPRKVSVSAPAGSYQLLVANFSTVDESVTGQVLLSLGTCPAFGTGAPAAFRNGGVSPSIEDLGRLRHFQLKQGAGRPR